VEVHGESKALELGGKRIFVHHFNDVGALVAASGAFDAVCYGHNHDWEARRDASGSLVINPGAIMGWHPSRGPVPSTYALYDTKANLVRVFDTDTSEVIGSAE
jgi:predicted phosphodiesterase